MEEVRNGNRTGGVISSPGNTPTLLVLDPRLRRTDWMTQTFTTRPDVSTWVSRASPTAHCTRTRSPLGSVSARVLDSHPPVPETVVEGVGFQITTL